MFNRRKDNLTKTTKENIQIYMRIQAQKSGLTHLRKKKSEARITPMTLGVDKENLHKINNYILTREDEITETLKDYFEKETAATTKRNSRVAKFF